MSHKVVSLSVHEPGRESIYFQQGTEEDTAAALRRPGTFYFMS